MVIMLPSNGLDTKAFYMLGIDSNLPSIES